MDMESTLFRLALALALGLAVEADGSVSVFIADIVGKLGRGVARLGHGLRVELARAVGRADIGSGDALQVDLHRPVAQTLAQGLTGLDDEPLMQIADALAI
jgi:hypothetical protein